MVFTAVIGLLIGSFINVCVWRIPRGQSIIRPGSHCPSCGHHLTPLELMPLLSFIFLHARCRSCQTAISWRYPLVEAATLLLFLAAYQIIGGSPMLPASLFLISILLVIALIDWEFFRIPDQLLWIAIIVGLLSTFILKSPDLRSGLSGFLIGGVLMLLIYILGRGGMGFGDVKLSAVLGFYLGAAGAVLAVFLASLLAAVVGIVLILSGRKTRRDAIPFAPFISAAGVIVLFWGERLIHLYRQILYTGLLP